MNIIGNFVSRSFKQVITYSHPNLIIRSLSSAKSISQPPPPGVEGDWKSYEIRRVNLDQDTPNLLQHLRLNFYRDEPLCNHLGYDETLAKEFDQYAIEALKDNLSLVAIHKPTNSIAGARVTSITRRHDGDSSEGQDYYLPPKAEKGKIVINFLTMATEKAQIFQEYPDIQEYVEFFMASVDRDHRGGGLLTEMYNRSLKWYRHIEIPMIKSVLTSPFTRKACENKGFRELTKLYLKDYVDQDSGKKYFPNATDDEIITVAVLKLL